MTSPTSTPAFPETELTIHLWDDPVLDQLGHDPRSAYVESFWVPVLGPSSYLLHRRLVATLETEGDGSSLVTAEWALDLGLGIRGGKHGPFWRSIDRLARFGALHRNGQQLAVRRRLAPLNQRQVSRLAEHIQLRHHDWEASQLNVPRHPAVALHQPRPTADAPHDLAA